MTLYPFQVAGVAFLQRNRRALLADSPGLGKTLQALIALPSEARAIVVCPKSALSVWLQEAEKWRPDLEVCCPGPPKKSPEAIWPQARELVIVNYESLPDALPGPGPFQLGPDGVYLIADEAHYLKSAKSLRTKRFRLLAKAILAQGGSAWALTGTPLLNRPKELWDLCASIGAEGIAFRHWRGFLELFQVPKKLVPIQRKVRDRLPEPETGQKPRYFEVLDWDAAQPLPEVRDRLATVMLRRKREDVLPELPEVRHRTLSVGLGFDLWKELDRLMDRIEAQGIRLDREDFLEALSRERVLFAEIARVRKLLALAKLPAALDLADEYDEQEEPLVVFSAHREPVEAFGRLYGWGAIHGDIDAAARGHLVSEFQAGNLVGLALTIQTGGTALTLTHAAHVLFVDEVWTPGLNEQAVDRLCRIGQTRGVLVTRLVGDHTLEERVAAVTARKSDLIERTL